MIGENIRQARIGQQRSLADVAKKAKISIATLSRIENDKQTLDLGLFLTLAKVLDRTPIDLIGDETSANESKLDPMVKKIVAFEASERAELWRELAIARRNARTKRKRTPAHVLAQQVEEMVAQFDFMREELENMRKRLRAAASR